METFAQNRLAGITVLAAIIVLLIVSAGRADWINLTGAETAPNIAEIRILEDRVNIRLEIFVDDLKTFIDVIPDDLLNNEIIERPAETDRLRRFSESILSILGSDGSPLPMAVNIVEPRLRIDRASLFAGMVNPQTGRQVPSAPADKRVLFVDLDYLFDARPDFLTFVPPLDDEQAPIVTVGFIAYHKSVPIIDFRYLSKPTRLQLDWDDPWYSRFDNPNLKRHHQNPLMSFLYVEPRRVRHEVLVRARDLQGWTDLGLGNHSMISTDIQDDVKARALRFFESSNPLQIDGRLSQPVTGRVVFLNLSTNGVQVIKDRQDIDLTTAVIGVSMTHPIEHMPKSVNIDWQLFDDRISRIPNTSIDPAGPFLTYIDRDSPAIEWTNYLKTYVEPVVHPVSIERSKSIVIPPVSVLFGIGAVISLIGFFYPRITSRTVWAGLVAVCLIGGFSFRNVGTIDIRNPLALLPDETEAAEVAGAVLGNVQIAFLESTEPRLKEVLARLVTEEDFSGIQLELSRAFAIKVAGGGSAIVNTIENLQVKEIAARESGAGFRSLVEWTALASGGHWGHPHRRRIRFRALMEFGEIGDAWKLAGITVVEAQQEA